MKVGFYSEILSSRLDVTTINLLFVSSSSTVVFAAHLFSLVSTLGIASSRVRVFSIYYDRILLLSPHPLPVVKRYLQSRKYLTTAVYFDLFPLDFSNIWGDNLMMNRTNSFENETKKGGSSHRVRHLSIVGWIIRERETFRDQIRNSNESSEGEIQFRWFDERILRIGTGPFVPHFRP